MMVLLILFFISLLFGQPGAIHIVSGVTVYIHDITLAVLLLGTVANRNRKRIKLPAIVFAILAFSFVALLSILIHLGGWSSIEAIQSLLYLGRFMYYSLLLVVVLYSDIPVYTWLRGVYLTGVGLALLGLGQFVFYPSLASLTYLGWDPYYYRVFSTLLDPNFTGILLVLVLLLGFYLWKNRKQHVLIVSQILITIALVLTSSRSSFLALAAGVTAYAIVKRRWMWIFGLVGVFLVYIAVPKPTMEAFRLGRTVSAFARVSNWTQSVALFLQEPLLGKGFGNRPLITSSSHVVSEAPSQAGSGIDSSFLFVLATTGIVGFVVYLGILGNVVGLVFEAMKKKKSLGTLALAWFIALFVHSFFTNSLFYPWVMIFLWIFLGALTREVSVDR